MGYCEERGLVVRLFRARGYPRIYTNVHGFFSLCILTLFLVRVVLYNLIELDLYERFEFISN